MLASKKTRRGVIGAVVLAGVLAVSGYALTDDLVTPINSHAGEGSDPVAQNTASAVNYVLDAADPNVIEYIEFDLLPGVAAGGEVFIQPETGGAWVSCAVSGAAIGGLTPTLTHPVCDATAYVGALNPAEVDQVRVVAAD